MNANSQATASRTPQPIWAWLRQYRNNPSYDAEMVLNTFERDAPAARGWSGLPIPVDDIAAWMGVEVRSAAGIPFSGQLDTTRPGVAIATLRIGDSETHRRFSLAHELGHLLMHDLGGVMDRNVTIPNFMRSKEEREANEFAASLLMPVKKLVPLARRDGYDIDHLASTFRVSPVAMTYRLKNLGLIA